jgi:antirestriction protein ArdC
MYRGINTLLLNMTSQARDYSSRWWGTERQWAKLGGKIKPAPNHIRESDWASTVYVYMPPKGNRFRGLTRRFKVYHLDQVEGPFEKWRPGVKTDPQYDLSDRVAEATGALIIYGGDKAIYRRPQPMNSWPNHTEGDFIRCPERERFVAPQYFHGTRFHELCHWAEVRVGWDGSYEMGELIAEMGGMFLCERTGIPPYDTWENHTAYLSHWLKVLRGDNNAIFVASAQASIACDYVLSYFEGKRKKS